MPGILPKLVYFSHDIPVSTTVYIFRLETGTERLRNLPKMTQQQTPQDTTGHKFLFFFFVFLGLHMEHMEVPMLGVELEL